MGDPDSTTALETLVDNTDDAYGFPPFRQMAPSIVIGEDDYAELRRKERAILTSGDAEHPGPRHRVERLLLGRRHRGTVGCRAARSGRDIRRRTSLWRRRTRRWHERRRPRPEQAQVETRPSPPGRHSRTAAPGPAAGRTLARRAGPLALAALPLLAVLALATFLRFWQLDRVGFNSDEAVYSGTAASIAGNDGDAPMFPIFRAHPLFFQILLSVLGCTAGQRLEGPGGDGRDRGGHRRG